MSLVTIVPKGRIRGPKLTSHDYFSTCDILHLSSFRAQRRRRVREKRGPLTGSFFPFFFCGEHLQAFSTIDQYCIHFIVKIKSKASKHHRASSNLSKPPRLQVQGASLRALDLVLAPGRREGSWDKNSVTGGNF